MSTKRHKGSNAEAATIRAKARDFRRHWTPTRSESVHAQSFAPSMPAKGFKRIARHRRMAEMYLAFFANPENMASVRKLKFEWGIEMCPRRVRDEVLGARRQDSRIDAALGGPDDPMTIYDRQFYAASTSRV